MKPTHILLSLEQQDDIDSVLAFLEDYEHGDTGRKITQARGILAEGQRISVEPKDIDPAAEYRIVKIMQIQEHKGWACPDSPTGHCDYTQEDGSYDEDSCRYCGQPDERK